MHLEEAKRDGGRGEG
jgi:hypothetical protein